MSWVGAAVYICCAAAQHCVMHHSVQKNQTTAAASKQRTPAKPPAVPGLPRGRTDMLARTMGITRVEDLPDRDHTVW